jgi:anaerobic ribonucleoside-triphosphate reductase activating protein
VTRVQISRVHAPVTTLGPGRRLGIWFQGCGIGCAGCVSRDTWEISSGVATSVQELADYGLDRIEKLSLTGVTISGGEPFEQPDALLELLRSLRAASFREPIDVLCYSGLPLKRIETHFPEYLELIDVLIPEPFVNKRSDTASWRGSSNQPVVLLSDLARERFKDVPQGTAGMQVVVDEQRVWLIGVPRGGDMDRLRRGVAAKGLLLEDVSWLA